MGGGEGGVNCNGLIERRCKDKVKFSATMGTVRPVGFPYVFMH